MCGDHAKKGVHQWIEYSSYGTIDHYPTYLQSWNVSTYRQRVGQIRIVDAASALWAHINVDDFRFSWDVHGGRFAGSTKITYAGREVGPNETPASCAC
jgi:hypothetical protein